MRREALPAYRDLHNPTGRSGAVVSLIASRTGRLVVEKAASRSGNQDVYDKLGRELWWYDRCPTTARHLFPRLYWRSVTPNTIRFRMPWYFDGATLENHYLRRRSPLPMLRSVFVALVRRLYRPTCTGSGSDLIDSLYLRRIELRLLRGHSSFVKGGLGRSDTEKLALAIAKLRAAQWFKRIDRDTRVAMTHGDLTLRNIVCRPRRGFVLVDVTPHGSPPHLSDPSEDLARVLAYLYPTLAVKQAALRTRLEAGDPHWSETRFARRCRTTAAQIYADARIASEYETLYSHDDAWQRRVRLLWALNVLAIAGSRFQDGNAVEGLSCAQWGINSLAAMAGTGP